MITGKVTGEGEPVVKLPIAGRDWPAVIDTGFNGDLQLPEACRGSLALTYKGRAAWILANNQRIEEDRFLTSIPFDGATVRAMVSFSSAAEILIGTHLLRGHQLTIDFVARTVLVEQRKTS